MKISESDSSQGNPLAEQEAMGKMTRRKTQPEHKRTLYYNRAVKHYREVVQSPSVEIISSGSFQHKQFYDSLQDKMCCFSLH